MSQITDQRLTELISLIAQDPHESDYHRDTDKALWELQKRRQRDAIVVELTRALKGLLALNEKQFRMLEETARRGLSTMSPEPQRRDSNARRLIGPQTSDARIGVNRKKDSISSAARATLRRVGPLPGGSCDGGC